MTMADPTRRTLLTGLAAAAALPALGFPTIVTAQTMPLRTSAFASFAAAVAAWARRGGTLLIDRDHVEPLPVTMACVPGLAYQLISDAPRRIAYGGPHSHWLLCILGRGGNPLTIEGDIEFDGRSACSIPFFARFELVSGRDRRDCTVSGLSVRNALMRRGRSRIDGSDTASYGATGMLFNGGFDRLRLSGVSAARIWRDAGAGRPGSQGCVGIGVTGALGTSSSAKHVTIEDFRVEQVGSDDPPGPARGDMDGVLVFQSAEPDGSRPLIRRGVIREAAGRAIKVFAPGGGGTTSQLEIHRSSSGPPGGSADINHQHGDGIIAGIRLFYSGNAHATPTTVIAMSSGHLREPGFPFGEAIVRDVAITDTTGRAKRTLFGLQHNLRDASPRRFSISDVRDSGTSEYLLLPGALGTFAPAAISIERVSVELTRGLLATEDQTALSLRARGLANRSARAVPVRTYYDGRPAVPGHRLRFDRDASVSGFGL